MEIWQIRERQPKSLSILCGETCAADILCSRWARHGFQKTLNLFPLLLQHAGVQLNPTCVSSCNAQLQCNSTPFPKLVCLGFHWTIALITSLRWCLCPERLSPVSWNWVQSTSLDIEISHNYHHWFLHIRSITKTVFDDSIDAWFKSVVRDAKENCETKMATWNTGGKMLVCFLPPRFHVATFSSRFSFVSRMAHKAKEGLLVV